MLLRLSTQMIAILLVMTAFSTPVEAVERSCVNVFDGTILKIEWDMAEVQPRAYEPKSFRENFIVGPEAEAARQAVLAAAPNDRVRKAFAEYLNLRLKHLPKKLQALARAAVESRKEELIYDALREGEARRRTAPPRFARIASLFGKHAVTDINIFVHPQIEGTAFHYAGIAHELEHVIQNLRVSDFHKYRFMNARSIYLLEFGAIRAEWEFYKLLPREEIEANIAVMKDVERGLTSQRELKAFREYRKHIESAHDSFERFHRNSLYPTVDRVMVLFGLFP